MSETSERTLSALDFFFLWLGAAISLAEIWAGGLLVPLGLVAGLGAIVLGHALGNTPMALAGVIGSRHGVPAMLSTSAAFGPKGAKLPALLNCIQLVGWTAVMLWICGNTVSRVRPDVPPAAGVVVGAILTTGWALSGHGLRKWLQRVAVSALAILSVLMTWVVARHYGWSRLLELPRRPDLSFAQGLDLVIAMPISWLPLVADYARFARSTRGAFWGTWWGYFLGSSWMYAVGLVAALATDTSSPDAMVMEIMAEVGLIWPALLIILLSTVTTTFLDLYSYAVSAQCIWPRLNQRVLIAVGGLGGMMLAIAVPATRYEAFLLFIGAAFCPAFGVVLTDYFILSRMRFEVPQKPSVSWPAIVAWALGFGLFKWAELGRWRIGASLPGLIGAGAIYFLATRALYRRRAA